jgi:hypothetical protein
VQQLSKTYTTNEISTAVKNVAPSYGVERVVLFGSYARGDAHSRSDVDLYIIAGTADFLDVCAMGVDIKSKLRRKVHGLIEEYMIISDTMREDIKNEGVTIYAKE